MNPASTVNNVYVTKKASIINNQPNHCSNKMIGNLTRVENFLIDKSQISFTDLPTEMLQEIAKCSPLLTLRNLKAVNSFMQKEFSQPFAKQARRILHNAVITLKESLAAGHTSQTVSSLENLDSLGLLTEKEISFLKNNEVNLNCVVNGKNLIERIIISNQPNQLRLAIKAGAALSNNHFNDQRRLAGGFIIEPGADLISLAAIHDKTGETIKILIEHGVSIDAQNEDGETALHVAANCRNLIAVETLLDHKADCNILNIYDETILYSFISMDEDYPLIVERLLEAGAKIDTSQCEPDLLSLAVSQFAKNNSSNLKTILDHEDVLNQSIEATSKAYAIAKELNDRSTINLLEERLNKSPYKK